MVQLVMSADCSVGISGSELFRHFDINLKDIAVMSQWFIWTRISVSECRCVLHVMRVFSSRVARFRLISVHMEVDFDIPVDDSFPVAPPLATAKGSSRKRSGTKQDDAKPDGTAGGASTKKSKQS